MVGQQDGADALREKRVEKRFLPRSVVGEKQFEIVVEIFVSTARATTNSQQLLPVPYR